MASISIMSEATNSSGDYSQYVCFHKAVSSKISIRSYVCFIAVLHCLRTLLTTVLNRLRDRISVDTEENAYCILLHIVRSLMEMICLASFDLICLSVQNRIVWLVQHLLWLALLVLMPMLVHRLEWLFSVLHGLNDTFSSF